MSAGRHLVLIVDDDKAVREALQFSLRLEGINVRTHAGGLELLADPELPCASCVILDDRMPDMDGFEILRELQLRDISSPTILLTGNATPGLQLRAAAAGARMVLEKPFLNNGLVENVLTILSDRTPLP
jgi:two-component system, LuxR family, response regulator FixJ